MRELFQKVDVKEAWKLDRENMLSYFKMLYKEMGAAYKGAAEVSEECFEDVWHETDLKETGYVTWHQVKPFIARIVQHEFELSEERRIAEEERQRILAEKKRRQEELEAARREAEEREAREAEEGIDD